jgi:hypothetical protein
MKIMNRMCIATLAGALALVGCGKEEGVQQLQAKTETEGNGQPNQEAKQTEHSKPEILINSPEAKAAIDKEITRYREGDVGFEAARARAKANNTGLALAIGDGKGVAFSPYDLSVFDKGVTDIRSFASLTNLTRLSLSQNKITDLRPIKNLKKLKRLNLAENEITDLTPLTDLRALEYLELGNNPISDLNPLSKMTLLRELHLERAKITDISPLNGIVKLEYLILSYNKVPLDQLTQFLKNMHRLQVLGLAGYEISDLSFLTQLNQVIIAVDLSANKITDLTPLAGLTHLQEINLNDNPKLTKAEIDKLQKALPKCKIHHNAKE